MCRKILILVCGLTLTLSPFARPTGAQEIPPGQDMVVAGENGPVLRLTEVLRLGSLEGSDAFGRVMDAILDSRGRVLVADAFNHHVVVFGTDGRHVGTIGRRGSGPGEFQSPWEVATDASDSIFVWDSGNRRVSVFDPDLRYQRTFRLPPHWLVSSIRFLPQGQLLLAAFGPGEPATLHVLDREGRLERSFGPDVRNADLAPFEASLLGGTAALLDDGIVFSAKSPYELWFFSKDGTPLRRCVGRADWTSRPASVIERRDRTAALDWASYVHSYNVVPLGDGLILNMILDPVRDRAVMDVVTPDCTLLRRTVTPTPLLITDAAGSRLVAVQNLEYPEVIVYAQRVERH